jgi:hypothetical protein
MTHCEASGFSHAIGRLWAVSFLVFGFPDILSVHVEVLDTKLASGVEIPFV